MYRETDEYENDGDGEDRVRAAEQQEKRERTAMIKKQFALRRGKNSASSPKSMKSRLKEQKEREKAEQQEKERAERSKLTNAEYTSKIVGLNVAVSFLKIKAQYEVLDSHVYYLAIN